MSPSITWPKYKAQKKQKPILIFRKKRKEEKKVLDQRIERKQKEKILHQRLRESKKKERKENSRSNIGRKRKCKASTYSLNISVSLFTVYENLPEIRLSCVST